MGVTLYNYPDYNYEGNSNECKPWWNEPCEAIDSTTLGVFASMPAYWEDDVDSIKIEPENAYEWCGWEHSGQRGYKDCYYANDQRVTNMNNYSSYSVKKNCNHSDFTWDDSCLNPSDGNKYLGNNYQNRKSICGSDLNAHPRCKEWCRIYPHECSGSITNYCNNLGDSNIDQMADDYFCKTYSAGGGITHSDRIKADKCVNNANLFPTNACTNYCINDKCLKSVQTYCANNMDQACQNFCKDNNLEYCTAAIKNHCFKNNNANMSSEYCKTAVRHKYTTSPFDDEMREYCNVLPNKPGSGSGRQRDLSKMVISTTPGKTASDIDNTLENPICSCFDEQLIKKKFSNVKQANAKDAFVTNPQCFLANCKNDPKAYKKKEPNDGCKITMCIIDADAINIVKSSDVKIENNCGPGAASITNGVPGTPGTPGANTPGADAPSTSTTTTTGTTTKDCKKTKCVTLEEQIKSKYFNYDDLNDNNKNIFVRLICLLIFLLFFIIYMASSD